MFGYGLKIAFLGKIFLKRSEYLKNGIFAENLKISLCSRFGKSADFNLREIGLPDGKKVYIAFFACFSDRYYISDTIIRPLLQRTNVPESKEGLLSCIYSSAVREKDSIESIEESIREGDCVLFFDTQNGALAFSVASKSDPSRSVTEPNSEEAIRGPREGFVESSETNVVLLRKRLKSPALCVEKFSVGELTNTDIRIVYLSDKADKKALELVREKLKNIPLRSVIDSGYIEQFFENGYTLFPSVSNSEKPDKVAAKIIGGRIAIICDGSPVVLTVPSVFVESIQSAEDYLKSAYFSTFSRVIRIIGMFVAIYLPAIYLALLCYSSDSVPNTLYITIAQSRKNIPFGVFSELLVILIIFEIIREVGIRMPRAVGDAVSIVAGIILGDAAIKAGISSEPVIMVAAMSATASFIVPPFMNSVTLLRLLNLFAALCLGTCGVVLSFIMLIGVLCMKESFGTPYLTPFSPTNIFGLSDSLLSLPKRSITRAGKDKDEKGGIK